MLQFLHNLFVSDFMPHGYCLFWTTPLVWLHVVSDVLITLAYYSIPIALTYFVRKREDLAFNWMFLMFGAFIFACGTTHLMAVWTLWIPSYWLEGAIKLGTAALSVTTAVLLWPLLPQALALPSPARLEAASRELQKEIIEHQRAEEALRESEERFQRIARATNDALWDWNLVTNAVWWNDGVFTLFGHQQNETEPGMTWWSKNIHPEDRERVTSKLHRLLDRGGQNWSDEYRYRRADGSYAHIFDRGYVLYDDNSKPVRMCGGMKDITERKRLEQRLHTQYATTRVLVESATLGEAAPEILQTICEDLEWDVGELWTVDREANLLRCVDIWHVPSIEISEFEAITRQATFSFGAGLPDRVWASGEPVWITDVVSDANFYRAPMAAKEGLHGVCAFPIRLESEIFGVIVFLSRSIREPDTDLIQVFATLSSQLGQFIERKCIEAALQESIDHYRQLFENANDGICILSQDGYFLEANQKFAELTGIPREEIIGKQTELFLPGGGAQSLERIKHIMQEGQFGPYEVDLSTPLGQKVFALNAFVYFERGVAVGVMGIARDVTIYKQVEETLRYNEKLYRTLAQNFPNGMVALFDRDLRYTIADGTGLATIGLSKEQLEGKTIWEVFPLETCALIEPIYRAALAGKTTVSEMQYGGYLYLVHALSVRNGHEEVFAGMVMTQDITERKQAEEALRKSEERFRCLVDGIKDHAIYMLDPDGYVMTWNKGAERITGYSPQEILGQHFSLFYYEQDERKAGKPEQGLKVAAAVGRFEDEGWRVRKDGSRFWAHALITALKDQTGELQGFAKLTQDLTERKQLEAQLGLARKLEAVGQLAAGIAHEINTPLQYVTDNTRFLHDAFGELEPVLRQTTQLLAANSDSPVPPALLSSLAAAVAHADVAYLTTEIPSALEHSQHGLEQVRKIVQAMKEFSHPGAMEKVATDLNRALETTLMVARNEWKYVAEVVTDFAPDLPRVPCLPGDINQVFLNLIVNAAHAIAEVVVNGSKGTIALSTRREGNWVEMRIRDTGSGIPEAVRERVFDPFFTTKEVGKGTGQGLALAYAVVVDKHGGSLSFETDVGKGTTFILRLPLTPSTPPLGR